MIKMMFIILIPIIVLFIFLRRKKPQDIISKNSQKVSSLSISNYDLQKLSNIEKFIDDLKNLLDKDNIIDYIKILSGNALLQTTTQTTTLPPTQTTTLPITRTTTAPTENFRPQTTTQPSITVLIYYKQDTKTENINTLTTNISEQKDKIKKSLRQNSIDKSINPIIEDKIETITQKVQKTFNEIEVHEDIPIYNFVNINKNIDRAIHVGIAKPLYNPPQIRDICSINYLTNKQYTFEDVVEIIPKQFFINCKIIEQVTIPERVKIIDEYAFSGCNYLESISFHDQSILKKLNHSAFKMTGIITIHIPKYVKTIGNEVFYDCNKLITITFEEGSKLNSIGNNTFYRCKSLTNIVLPKQLKTIGENIFQGCDKLENISLPSQFYQNNDQDTLQFLGINNENIIITQI